jgi:5-hydroxyisourate hydrolase-like protein (transthyretin family)
MEFIAFKSLKRDGFTLHSPQQGTPWMYDIQGRPCLVADSLKGRHGIYAASWEEARRYGNAIYMVVPYLFDGGDPVIAMGSHGWRSSMATVIAGPWACDDRDGMLQAAEFILASYMQGYRQVEGILVWAPALRLPTTIMPFPLRSTSWSAQWAMPTRCPEGGRARRRPDRLARAPHPGARRRPDRLGDGPEADVRWRAVRDAGQIGLPALHILERAMGDADTDVRAEAVRAAGQIGLPALHILERAMGDADTDVRAEAVRAAGQIGLPALHILERAMGDAEADVRVKAVRAADQIGLPALHILKRGLGDADMDVRLETVSVAYRHHLNIQTLRAG